MPRGISPAPSVYPIDRPAIGKTEQGPIRDGAETRVATPFHHGVRIGETHIAALARGQAALDGFECAVTITQADARTQHIGAGGYVARAHAEAPSAAGSPAWRR